MADSSDRKLLNIYGRLTSDGRRALLDYAVFLESRYATDETVSQQPQPIERPEEETVIAAIQRLSRSYPMLNREALLHETASYVMQYMVQGRATREVIDDLELYFRRQYEAYLER